MKARTLGAIILALAAGGSSAAHRTLDYRGAVPASRLAAAADSGADETAPADADGVVRETRLAAAEMPAADGALAVGDRLSLRLFADSELDVTLVEELAAPLVGRSFLGVVGTDGEAPRTAVVLQTADGLQMHLQDLDAGRTFVVSSTPQGAFVREVAPRSCDDAEDALPAEDAAPGARRGPVPEADAGEPPDGLLRNAGAGTCVDLLMVYDTPAANWAAENGYGLLAFAQMQTDKMNAALGNTGLSGTFAFRLKGVRLLDGSLGTSTKTALQKVRNGVSFNGVDTSKIHDWRDAAGADLVCTFIDTLSATGTTGTGYSLTDYENPASFSESAYNVTAIRAVATGHTMTHEVGHNMGAGHADAIADASNAGPQSYSFSRGYYFTGTDATAYHTIMAYNYDGFGNRYVEAPYFSSPNHVYKGHAVGDAEHNNTLAIRNLAGAVAAFRAETAASPSDIVLYNVLFSPENGSVVDGTLEVTLTPATAGAEIRYTTDGSTPTAGSPKYVAPVRISGTTTVKAVSIVKGVAGGVYQAKYYRNDLGAGLDASGLSWTTDGDAPWRFAVDKTHDGIDAVRSGVVSGKASSHLRTKVYGPGTLHFHYCKSFNEGSSFTVGAGGSVVYSDAEATSANSTAWKEVTLAIGAGEKELDFAYNHGARSWSGCFNGVHLDELSWSGATSIAVTFDANGGTPKTTVLRAYGAALGTLPSATRTGYTLAGWFTARTGGTRIDAARRVSGPATYYAHWTANRYSVRFAANGGSGGMAALACTYGARAQLPAATFVRKGYRFAGWSTAPAGKVAYADGATVLNLASAKGAAVTLYAVWEKRREPSLFAKGDASPHDASAAQVYTGWLRDADGCVYGTLEAKIAKPRADRATGAMRAKVSLALATSAGKERVKAELADARVQGTSRLGALDLRFAGREMKGSLGPFAVTGARNVFASRDAASKTLSAALLAKWKRTFAVVDPTVRGCDIFSVTVGAKGKAKVSGTLADGTRISASAQLAAGDGICAVPVFCGKRGRTVGFALWLGVPSAASGLDVFGLDQPIVGCTGGTLGGTVDFGTLPAGYARLENARDEAWKVRLAPRTGAVKGSFKVGTVVNGRLKKVSVSVSGILVGDTAYCTASVRNAGAWTLKIR